MHSKIFQLSTEPISKEDYKTADDYVDTGFMQIADYTDDMDDEDRESCIDWFSKYLASGAELKNGVLEIKDKKKLLEGQFQTFRKTAGLLQYVSLDDFCEPEFSKGTEDLGYLMYTLDAAYSDKYGYYVDIDDYPAPLSDFLRRAHNGDRYYIGAVIDYHF